MRRRKHTGALPKPPPAFPDNELGRTAELYLDWMSVHHFSPNTVTRRRRYLLYFIEWCDERSLREPQEITRAMIERYQRYLFHYKKQRDSQPLSVRAQSKRLHDVRAYFKYLARYYHILYDPTADIIMPKVGRVLPRDVMTLDEVEQVLAMPDLTTTTGIRDRALLEVLYSTGLRRSELVRLNIYDVDLDGGSVFVRQGKGNKDRVVPIGARAVKWVEKYLFEVRSSLVMEPDEGYLFLTRDAEYISADHLSSIVRGYIRSSGIGKQGACHIFRHTVATLMLENGADIRYIQQMLGHELLSTTQVYTHVSISQLKRVHTLTHPARNHPHRAQEIIAELDSR